MKTPKTTLNILVVTISLFVVAVWFCSRTGAAEKTYEIRPESTLGAYRSDSARIMDAYERLMERYMSLVEGKLVDIGAGGQTVVKKLDTIEKKIDRLATRITRIEKALDIQPPEPGTNKAAEKKTKQ
ncbi:MAG TPA: hypothetical protein HPP87_07675 [Planctomycetes bacterium]|nr:hypothetical protein [Planctomycetota bacterium]